MTECARPEGGGGRPPKGGRAQEEEDRRASAEGAPDAPGEAGRLEQRGEGGGEPPLDATQQGYVRARGGASPSTEEGADLQGFTPAREHLLFQEVYGDFPNHNDGTHLSGGVPENATRKICWRRLAAQSDSYYSTTPGKVGGRFTAVLAAE